MTNFYQSPSDKARFDVLLKVLSEEAPNLAIIGDECESFGPKSHAERRGIQFQAQ